MRNSNKNAFTKLHLVLLRTSSGNKSIPLYCLSIPIIYGTGACKHAINLAGNTGMNTPCQYNG